MGYRLEIYDTKGNYLCCGGKLYGYITDIEKCKSLHWLRKHGKTNEDEDGFGVEWYEYDGENEQLLTNSEFKEFIQLYIDDKKKLGNYHQLGENLDEYKTALDLENVVIRWE